MPSRPRPVLLRPAAGGLVLLALALAGCSSSDSAPVAAAASLPAPLPATPPPAAEPTDVPAATPWTTASPRATHSAPARPTATAAPRQPEQPEDPLSPRPALESPPPPGRPTCRAAALTVADADAVYTDTAVQELFTVRTTGPDCQLSGFPAVQLRGAGGAPMAVRVTRGGYGLRSRASVVTLSRTTSVSFFVATARDGQCSPVGSVAVTLPGSGGARTVASGMQVCGGAAGIGPVQRLGDEE